MLYVMNLRCSVHFKIFLVSVWTVQYLHIYHDVCTRLRRLVHFSISYLFSCFISFAFFFRFLMSSSNLELKDGIEYEENFVELLMDFLYKIKLHHRLPQILCIFSAELNILDCFAHARPYVETYEEQFKAVIGPSILEIDGISYIHVAAFRSTLSRPERRVLTKGLAKVSVVKAHENKFCLVHNSNCDLLTFTHGFLIFLDIKKGSFLKDVDKKVEEPNQEATREEDD